ncbi:MAG: thioredoxin domain-containing protein, partial [Anaerolineales bacterium]
PFFCGTYYPPVRRYNMPAFREVLTAVHQTWQSDRQGVRTSANKIRDYLQRSNQLPPSAQSINPDTLDNAAFALAQSYDWKFGGWGSAPKFPQPMAIEFLLRRANNGDQLARDIAVHALRAMAQGGMYDVIGGGFARYSTDNEWLIPHFEKMLYDNAQLALAYLHAYLVTGEADFRLVCERTLDFILRELTHPMGGFYSSLDADSEGEEGKFYVWTAEEIRQVLPEDADYQIFIRAYDVEPGGNFEGKIVLQRTATDEELAESFSISPSEMSQRLQKLHNRLRDARDRRIRPATDDKVLTAWNALALDVFSEAARYLQRGDYLEAARRNAAFILQQVYKDGLLLRSWRNGKAQHNAYLEDHASLILALISLYQSDPDPSWYSAAERLTQEMIDHFYDPQGGFYDTRDDQTQLVVRPKDVQDNATPSGNSLAASALIYMTAYTGESNWRARADVMLAAIQSQAARYPTAFANWLCAFDALLTGVSEVAIIGNPHAQPVRKLADVLWESYRPNLVAAISDLPLPEQVPPLLTGRKKQNDLPTAYVCRDFMCQRPVNTAKELRIQLEPPASS